MTHHRPRHNGHISTCYNYLISSLVVSLSLSLSLSVWSLSLAWDECLSVLVVLSPTNAEPSQNEPNRTEPKQSKRDLERQLTWLDCHTVRQLLWWAVASAHNSTGRHLKHHKHCNHYKHSLLKQRQIATDRDRLTDRDYDQSISISSSPIVNSHEQSWTVMNSRG